MLPGGLVPHLKMSKADEIVDIKSLPCPHSHTVGMAYHLTERGITRLGCLYLDAL